MSPTPTTGMKMLAEQVLKAFDTLTGPHPGFRSAHAKGILLSGQFAPSSAAKSLTKAPHILRDSTPVSVRFSDFAGIPTIPDNHPEASPRGLAIRFHLAEHVHTDIISHSVDGFPARTAEEFLEMLQVLSQSGPDAAKPTPIERFLGSHPAALAFVQTPKPMPVSFAKAAFFAVNAYKFTNSEGISKYGRYRLVPDGGAEYLDAGSEAKAPPDFLFDEIRDRLTKGTVKMRIEVQVASKDDIVDDSTIHWPANRPIIDFGVIEMKGIVADNEVEQRHIIFDPIPRVDGIETSGDPLLDPRATVYLMGGRRRRAEHAR